MCAESKLPRLFAISCLGSIELIANFRMKYYFFFKEICEFRDKQILKIGLFHRVKELCKSNQTQH